MTEQSQRQPMAMDCLPSSFQKKNNNKKIAILKSIINVKINYNSSRCRFQYLILAEIQHQIVPVTIGFKIVNVAN